MGKIKLLSQETINQIAAGEVIDRPASVVKELLENAIDAGATIVTVEIKDGGTSLIRISDNGVGIAKEDIQTAFLRHSTSKIKSVEDLLTVSSLGFRGEALSSIAAVCQVDLITKTEDSFLGCKYVIEGGNEVRLEDVGAGDGTTFIVKNIFFNTPARRKFLKSPQTEAGYVSDVVERIALSHPEVSIRFISNNQAKIHTPGNGNLKDVIYNIYGRDIANNLIPVNAANDFMKIEGFIGKPVINKGNRTYENYFINGRYIKSAIISKAIEEAYKPYLMQHKYPYTTLHLTIDSDLLDVNVHPAKMELRFKNADKIYPFIVQSLGEALKEKPLIPDVSLEEKKTEAQSILKRKEERAAEPFEVKRIANTQPAGVVKEEKLSEAVDVKGIDYSKINVPIQKPQIVNKAELKINHSDYAGSTSENFENKYNKQVEETSVVKKAEAETEIKEINKVEEMLVTDVARKTEMPVTTTQSEQKATSDNIQKIEQEQISLFENEFLSEQARPKHKIVGQVFDTYWIVEYDGKMFIIDQHAAHEKVLYETLMERLKNKETASQNLNPPIIISLSMSEEALVNKSLDSFKEIGFEIESFGGREYAIRAVPLDLYALNDKSLIMDIIDNLESENGRLSSELLTDKIASMSCKAAVKGNNKLSVLEANELIDKLLKLDNPYNCPHGRPTIISMSKYELEKKFKRII